ncbi:hypothetical protein EDC04DRAFT_2579652, partial [Pisolithus marmoratus]
VDTPEFDDTYRSDRDILRTIADWLEKKYGDSVKLTGIVYTHHITDDQMLGSVCANLDMLGRLCGDAAALCVRLVGQSERSKPHREQCIAAGDGFLEATS